MHAAVAARRQDAAALPQSGHAGEVKDSQHADGRSSNTTARVMAGPRVRGRPVAIGADGGMPASGLPARQERAVGERSPKCGRPAGSEYGWPCGATTPRGGLRWLRRAACGHVRQRHPAQRRRGPDPHLDRQLVREVALGPRAFAADAARLSMSAKCAPPLTVPLQALDAAGLPAPCQSAPSVRRSPRVQSTYPSQFPVHAEMVPPPSPRRSYRLTSDAVRHSRLVPMCAAALVHRRGHLRKQYSRARATDAPSMDVDANRLLDGQDLEHKTCLSL